MEKTWLHTTMLCDLEFVMDFYSGSGTTTDESIRNAMLAGVHMAYEVRRILCPRACVSGVGGALQR